MRYAIVIERAENNYAAYVPDLPGVSPPEKRSRKQSNKSAKRSSFTFAGCAKMACLSQNPLAMWITSK